jgi:hypothetical protein
LRDLAVLASEVLGRPLQREIISDDQLERAC